MGSPGGSSEGGERGAGSSRARCIWPRGHGSPQPPSPPSPLRPLQMSGIASWGLALPQGLPAPHVTFTAGPFVTPSLDYPNWKTVFSGLLYHVRALTVLFSENKAPQRHLLESKPVGGFSQNPGQGSRSAWCRGPQLRSRAGRAPSLQPRPGLGVRGPPGFLRGMDQSGGALCLLGSPTERWRLE